MRELTVDDWITIAAFFVAGFALFDAWRVRRALRSSLAAQRTAENRAASAEARVRRLEQADTTDSAVDEVVSELWLWKSVGLAALGDPDHPPFAFLDEGRRRLFEFTGDALYKLDGHGCHELRDWFDRQLGRLHHKGDVPDPHSDDQRLMIRAGEIHAAWELSVIDTTPWGRETLERLIAEYRKARPSEPARKVGRADNGGSGHDHTHEPITVPWPPPRRDNDDIDPDSGPWARGGHS